MTNEIKKRDGRFILKAWHLILATVVVLVGAIAVYVAVCRKAVQQRLEALRAAGYPTSFAELAEYTKLPDGASNAAEAYERAFAAFVPPVDEANVPILGKARLPDRGVPLPEPMVKATSKCLAANEQCLTLLHEAAGIESCRYDWDYADRLLLWKTPSHWDGVKRCKWLLRLSTIFHAHLGDTEAAVLDIRDGLQLSESARREPGWLAYIIRLASRAEALWALEWALSLTTFTDQQLIELDGMLGRSAATLDLREALITQRCFTIEEFKDIERSGPGSLKHLIRTGGIILWAPGMQKRGLADTLDYMEDYVEAADLSTMQRMARFRGIGDELSELSIIHAVAKEWAPIFTEHISELDPRIHVHFALARTALAVERYRRATGKIPRQLEELVPQYLKQVPLDPFDGKPLRYKQMEPGYLLYSILQDGQDNGGRQRNGIKDTAPYDWCFIVTR